MVEGLRTLQQHNIPHECLTTKTLLVECGPGGGELGVRVVDPLALPVHTNLDLVYHKRSLKHVYLSPSQCDMVREQNMYGRVKEPYKDDVFVGGVIMLECCSLERQDECYPEDSARVDFAQVDRRVSRVEQEYGPKLAQALGWMLQRHPENRPEWVELASAIEKESAGMAMAHPLPALDLSS